MSEADKIIESLKNSGRKVEEFYTGNKTSDKNVVTEDDVKILEEFAEICKAGLACYDQTREGEALENILAEREQMLKERDVANDSVIAHKFAVMQQQINEKDKRIQELEEESRKKSIELICYQEELKNSIPTQVVIAKIEQLKNDYDKKYDVFMGYKVESREQQDILKQIGILQELLKEDKQ